MQRPHFLRQPHACDRKLSTLAAAVPVDFEAQVVVMRDHYAFGMEMPGQQYAVGEYRYGFNGMERDDEVKGTGDSYDFGARMYDPRVGRWWSCDPMEADYPTISPYVAFGNSPIFFVDPGGESSQVSGATDEAYSDILFLLTEGQQGLIKKNDMGQIEWAMELPQELKNACAKDNAGFALVSSLIDSKMTYEHKVGTTSETINMGYNKTKNYWYDPNMKKTGNPSGPTPHQLQPIDPNKFNVYNLANWRKALESPQKDFAEVPYSGADCQTVFSPSVLNAWMSKNGKKDYRYSFIFQELGESFLMMEGMNDMLRQHLPEQIDAICPPNGTKMYYGIWDDGERDYLGAHGLMGSVELGAGTDQGGSGIHFKNDSKYGNTNPGSTETGEDR